MENKYNLNDYNTFSSRTEQFQESEEENKSKASKVIVDFNIQEENISTKIEELEKELKQAKCLKNSLDNAIIEISEQVKFKFPVLTTHNNELYVFGEDLNAMKVSDTFH